MNEEKRKGLLLHPLLLWALLLPGLFALGSSLATYGNSDDIDVLAHNCNNTPVNLNDCSPGPDTAFSVDDMGQTDYSRHHFLTSDEIARISGNELANITNLSLVETYGATPEATH